MVAFGRLCGKEVSSIIMNEYCCLLSYAPFLKHDFCRRYNARYPRTQNHLLHVTRFDPDPGSLCGPNDKTCPSIHIVAFGLWILISYTIGFVRCYRRLWNITVVWSKSIVFSSKTWGYAAFYKCDFFNYPVDWRYGNCSKLGLFYSFCYRVIFCIVVLAYFYVIFIKKFEARTWHLKT